MKRLEKKIAELEEWFLGLLVITMALLVVIQVFYRFALNTPLSWSEELSRLCLVWIGFIGTVIALRKGEHITISKLSTKETPKMILWTQIIKTLFIIIFSIVLFVISSDLVSKQFITTTPALGIPSAWFTIPVPLAAFLMIFHSLVEVYERIRMDNRVG